MDGPLNELLDKQKLYFNRFLEKNKDRLREQIECPICYGTFTYFNKNKHNKSKRHLRMAEKQKEKELISEDLATHLYGSP
jgi:hypothetical protein